MKKQILLIALSLYSMLHVPCSLYAQLPSYVPTSGLVGWWPFNGNGNDESGNGNDLANTNGAVNYASDRNGASNSCASFNGSAYLSKSNPTLPTGNSNRTYSVWVKMNQTTSGTAFCQNGGSCDNYAGLFCGIDGAYFWGKCNDRFWGYTTTTAQWDHIVLVYNNSVMYCFRNGVLMNVANSTYYNFPSPLNTNSSSFFVGYPGETDGTWPLPMNGYVDDLAIYNRALSEQEVTNLFTNSLPPPTITTTASPSLINCGESATLTASSTSAAQPCAKADLPATLQNGLVGYWPFCGNANDASGNGNDGTVNGATLTTDRFGNANSAYSFEGNSITTNFNLISGISERSMSFWFKPNANSNSGERCLVGFGGSNSCGAFFDCNLIENSTIRVNFGVAYIDFFNYPINSNEWNFVTVTYSNNGSNNSSVKLSLNGVILNSSTSLEPCLINTQNIYNLRFGRNAVSNLYLNDFSGKIDDVAIYNRALTATEVQQLYSLGNVNYTWSTGATTPSITVSPAQTTSYSVTATNSAGSTTSSVTVNVADSLSWTGLVDTDWHKPCNWSPQFVPKCCNNVLIPVTSNQPIVSGVAAAEDLTIYTTNGAQLTINNGANLQIADCPTSITTVACPSLAILTTTFVTNNTQPNPLSGGTISYEGSSPILARGVCWSLSTNPTIANSFSSDGAGIGIFSSSLTGLIAGSTYFVRAYATNASGTSYGDEVSFVYSPNFVIGDNYGGGIVAYLFQPGDQGYVAGQQHGIICSATDQSSGVQWFNGSYCCKTWANDDAIGFGQMNTNKILNVQGSGTYAASITDNLVLNGYSDWFLPSINELQWVYNNRAIIGGFSGIYWSSSEFSAGWNYVKVVSFDQGWTGSRAKAIACKVRAIRYF